MANVRIKRGTRAQIEAAAAGGTLADGEPYLITDEGRIAVGTGASTYTSFLLEGEGATSGDVLRQPTNLSPAPGATTARTSPKLVCSAYYSLMSVPQDGAQFQVSASSDFATPLHDSGVTVATDNYTLPEGVVSVASVYHWRARYMSLAGTWSNWSTPSSFTTAAYFADYTEYPVPTPAAFGDPLEGGFYAGLIWNELVQSASSTTIGTGEKTFQVPTMSSTPLVYAGQQLEVRSRANPANKMVGIVTGALGTSLTVSVASVGGSGTFADWSIMARYRVIVAPKASGESAAILWKSTASAGPVATMTLSEGRKATLAMVAAGTSAVYPAAHFCNSLSIGGRTDWYLPARDELELCWRNLKPVSDANALAARPAVGATEYQNQGSYGGAETSQGLNKNSAPVGAAYTSADPAQTSSLAFQAGGAEAFAFGAAYYWSSSEHTALLAWAQNWYTGAGGQQGSYSKTSNPRARAVRRSII